MKAAEKRWRRERKKRIRVRIRFTRNAIGEGSFGKVLRKLCDDVKEKR